MLVLWFLVLSVLFWLIYFSLKPPFVLNGDNQLDAGLLFIAALLSAFVLELIVLFIKWLIGYYR